MDHPDYKYQPRRKKLKGPEGEEGKSPVRKVGRRTKNVADLAAMDSNSNQDDKSYEDCNLYNGSLLKNDISMTNYASSSYSYFMQNHAESPSGMVGQSNMKNGLDYETDYYNRKYDNVSNISNKNVASPCSSTDEQPLTPPETPYNLMTYNPVTAQSSEFTNMSPNSSISMIPPHMISKDDYFSMKFSAPNNDCVYYNNEPLMLYNKDANQMAKAQEPYRIFPHQTTMQSPSSSSGSSNGYQYSSYPFLVTSRDTDVDPKEMEQYLHPKLCYVPNCNMKPDNNLTELSPVMPNNQANLPKTFAPQATTQPAATQISPDATTNQNQLTTYNFQENATVPNHFISTWVNQTI